ncbi:acetyl/propionyl/methylcrotonyl-CoA carboxylase subunit alpha [Ruania zhangjianzhongii]|uniref:acetyl/propionyl/methylcrotonyl-CoA carboxylase subunit alpha n=1 Tax=Ruania zhangjianzhongii TaxID=2603206 RepID=UPI0011C742C4|nr:biotin carboxylase N-terminal domain-containing protein [Ruania zhangjianzhongii]
MSTSAAPQPAVRPVRKVLIANRGEIAVRIVRACRDAGLTSVAVYADPDREALHAALADEAYALHGSRAAETYLDINKILDVARRAGADAVHPGYGFLAENAEFARAMIAAGLTWVGPPPEAIEALGDKVSARHIAERAGAPLVAGTPEPVTGAEEVHAFAAEHGLPVAIKAAFGGGGRGLKVARTSDEIDDLYESAVREATAAFGRGECFVERFLDRPRHVETQCLADDFGTVVVVSTRDCSLQRRHQKLVEEAPAPFLTQEQDTQLREASQAILAAAGYRGAGTCEFLIGADGTISFLEVNTRLQVEHCVTEEVAGIDLVREQFRIAAGEPLGYTEVTTRGHSIEFRMNGEDPHRGFLPSPGTIGTLRWPGGPGVRIDSGVNAGDVISGAFDSMLAKVIVTGATRTEAIQRARRAMAETEVTGIPTVLPFFRAVLGDEDFAATEAASFGVYTTWIESEFAERLASYADGAATPAPVPAPAASAEEAMERVVVEVGGKRLEVVLPAGLSMGSGGRSKSKSKPSRRNGGRTAAGASGGNGLASPMQGTIVKVAVADGELIAEGDLVVVLEAMKMEQPLVAHRAGRIHGLSAGVGETVSAGTVICQIDAAEDAAD